MAGLDDLPYEDFNRRPRWKASEGLEDPWTDENPSPLLKIPGQASSKQAIFRKDPFHIFKQTVGGHWVASGIVLFLDLGYWSVAGGSNQADILPRFQLFCEKGVAWRLRCKHQEFHQSFAPLAKDQILSLWKVQGV